MFLFPERTPFDLQLRDGSVFPGCQLITLRQSPEAVEEGNAEGWLTFDYVGPMGIPTRVQVRIEDVSMVLFPAPRSLDDAIGGLR